MSASLHSPGSSKLRLSMPCDLGNIRPFSQMVRDFLVEENLAEEEVAACELALVEACNNAVLYVSKSGQNQPIEIEVVCDESKVDLQITDHTRGFVLPEKLRLPAPQSESGRGLFIIQSVMDEVRYDAGNAENTMSMSKLRLDSAGTAQRFSPKTFQEFTRKLAESEQIISDMADELSSCYESLSAIFRCGVELGKDNNLKEFSVSLCNDLLQIAGADWYVLRIVPPADHCLRVFASSDKALDLKPLHFPTNLASSGVDRLQIRAHEINSNAGTRRRSSGEEDQPKALATISSHAVQELDHPMHDCAEIKAAMTRYDVWFDSKNPLAIDDPLKTSKPNSIGLVHPFFFAGNLMGTLAVGKNPGRPEFTAAQANVVHTFSDFLAIQIANARLHEEQLKSRLISRELEIARTIQAALLPKTLPQPDGFCLAGYCESARQVGGDFYDVVKVSDTSLLLIIADVMGKGIPAAMFASILRSLLRAMPELNQHPAALLSRVNRLLFEELSEVEMFITAQVTYLDFTERKMIAASAGHCPILLASPQLNFIKAVSPDGIPLGILPDAHFGDQKEDLLPDLRLLLYTDGVTEARNTGGSFFGQQELLDWFQQSLSKPHTADQLKNSLAQKLKEFQGSISPNDDQTFLILAEENSARRNYVRENSAGG